MPERTCPNCHEPVDEARYCPECGQSLTDAEAAPLGPPEEFEASPSSAEGESEAEEPTETSEEDPTADTSRPPEGPDAAAPPPPPPDEAFAIAAEGSEESERFPRTSEPPPTVEEDEADAGVDPDAVEPRGPHQEPEVAGATPLQQASEQRYAPGPVPPDGQLRCPHCGEAVYRGESRCWSCGRRIDEPAQLREGDVHPPALTRGPAPSEGAMIATEPEPASPVTDRSETRPDDETATRPQERAAEGPSEEAISYAWWALGLGIVSVFTCGALGLLGAAAIWFGAAAARKDAGPMAVVGMVLGAMGLLMLLAWIIGFAVLLSGMRASPDDWVNLITWLTGGVP